MNRIEALILKTFRKLFEKTIGLQKFEKPACEQDPDEVARIIYDILTDDSSCMIARFGANELNCLVNYVEEKGNYLDLVKGKSQPWWFEHGIRKQMHEVAGFFPPEEEKLEQFCELMIKDIPLVDILASWQSKESYFENELQHAIKVKRIYVEPFWANRPWTEALKGKNVLVIHPFTKTIKNQYKKRELLFDKAILPQFNLETIKAVQGAGRNQTGFEDWFQALDYMKGEMDKIDYDICLIGAGAFGFPLAAHAKRMGKKGIHVGGTLQLFFGIRGKRWEIPNYNQDHNYMELMNDYWVRPLKEETPQGAQIIEGSTYW